MRYNDETEFHELFKDSDVINIVENEIPGLVFYIIESPLWDLTAGQTIGYVKSMYSSVLDMDEQKIERIFRLIEELI